MKIGIIGAGTMGIGIAQIAASAGNSVLIYDSNFNQIEKSLDQLKNNLKKKIEKGRISEEIFDSILKNLESCKEISGLKDCNLVIEAIIEDKNIKQKVFAELENYVSENCIIGTNTSSISITSLQSALKFPERFIGIHFFNPAPILPLVEIIPGLLTHKNLGTTVLELMKSWGKTPILAKDVPGFIVNRIARPFYGEALRIVEEQIATPIQIDNAMKMIGGFKMGPFELMDLIGIDVNFLVTKTVYTDYFYDPKYKPSLLQQRMYEAKLWGKKTGKGFYDYSGIEEKPSESQVYTENDKELYNKIFYRIISMLVNEAVEAKRLGIAIDEDIELAMQKGVNYPKGLLAWGKEIGYKRISEILKELYEEYQEERYRQSPLLLKLQ